MICIFIHTTTKSAARRKKSETEKKFDRTQKIKIVERKKKDFFFSDP